MGPDERQVLRKNKVLVRLGSRDPQLPSATPTNIWTSPAACTLTQLLSVLPCDIWVQQEVLPPKLVTIFPDDSLQPTKFILQGLRQPFLAIEGVDGPSLQERHPVLPENIPLHDMQVLKGPGVHLLGQKRGLMVQLPADA